VEDLHDTDDNLNDIDDLDAKPGWPTIAARWHQYGDSYHVRTPTIYAAELSSSPELSDMRIIHGPAQLDARMPMFVTAFLQEQWRQGTAKTY
jgi:hypothetical protein